MELYQTPAGNLDTFIAVNLQPNNQFLNQVRSAIHIICEFFRENCFRDTFPHGPRVIKVVKGGSSGKGTALKGGSDADLVLFLNVFKGYKDQEKNRTPIIQEIAKRLMECKEKKQFDVYIERSKWENPRVLSFKLYSRDFNESIEFDVLPAFDALGQLKKGVKPDPEIYVDLINSQSGGGGGEFSTCFTELQRDFIVERPTKLKSLIRLVKHWYKQLQREKLPPKYALELLTVYAWEQGSERTNFNMAEGFKTVLWLIQQYKELCIFWTINYDFENETLKQYIQEQLRQKPRPIILDPADPTGNVGKGKRWDLLAKEAAYCSAQKCCRNPDGSPVCHWNVPLQVPWESDRSYCTIL